MSLPLTNTGDWYCIMVSSCFELVGPTLAGKILISKTQKQENKTRNEIVIKIMEASFPSTVSQNAYINNLFQLNVPGGPSRSSFYSSGNYHKPLQKQVLKSVRVSLES